MGGSVGGGEGGDEGSGGGGLGVALPWRSASPMTTPAMTRTATTPTTAFSTLVRVALSDAATCLKRLVAARRRPPDRSGVVSATGLTVLLASALFT